MGATGATLMSATHADRHAVYESLEPLVGEAVANTIMDLLPSHPESELVTRTDMHATATLLRGEMSELRSELRGEMAELRGDLTSEMTELRSESRGEMAELRGDLTSEMTELRGYMIGEFGLVRSELSTRFERNQQWLLAVVSTNLLAILGAAIAVVIAIGA